MSEYTDQVIDGSTNPATSFRTFLDEQRGGIKPNDHGNPNPLLRILPALYNGNFTVGQALAILFSGSPSDLSQEALDNATNAYLTPTDKAIEAISTVLGLPSSAVSDQILQHNSVADPDKALTDENPYALATDQETTTTVEETIGDEEYTTDLLPVPDLTPDDDKVEVTDVGGTELTGVGDTTESTYTLPENEPVDVTELTEEQQTDIWDEIKKALNKIPETIGKVIFGPDGMPANVDEWIEWVDETLQAQMGPENLPFPIVITTNPQEGTWIDLKIPVNFEANGTPIRIPLFDEDGNFVSSEELGEAWVDAKGQIFGPLGEIGEIFLDKDGNLTLDLEDLEDVLLGDLTLNPDGSITGSTAGEILVGKWFFNPDTEEWEEEEVVDINEDTVDDDTTAEGDDPDGLYEEEDEDPTPSAKPPRGNLITDKDGNPIRIIGEDGTNYVLDEDGQWVAAVVGEGEGGETVLQGTTTGETEENDDEVVTNEEEDDEEQVVTEGPELKEAPLFTNSGPDTRVVEPPFQSEEEEEVVTNEEEEVVTNEEEEVVTNEEEEVVTNEEEEEVVVVDEDDEEVVVVDEDDEEVVVVEEDDDEEVVVVEEDDDEVVVVDEDDEEVVIVEDPLEGNDDEEVVIVEDPLEGNDEEEVVIVEDPLEGNDEEEVVIVEDPLVGITAPTVSGGGGGGKRESSGGMMGGFGYNLPGFVEVQYQPKNYNAELDRIINESLFKGMI
jgi:hypothetical protein